MRLLRPMLALLALAAWRLAAGETNAELQQQVRAMENTFAQTMADRDLSAFASHIADDAVFFGRGALRGRTAVVEAWKRFFEGPQAPFSWKPETVEVLESGTLAHSSGPVFDPAGRQTGTFNSIWRRAADGRWKIVFDKGCEVCNCAAK